MVSYEEPDFDPQFAKALSLAGPDAGEFEFERRGTGDSTYPMHALILGVDEKAGVIILRRTRTHAGRVQEMALRYFLTATSPQGVKLVNRVAVERETKFRDKQHARETTVATVLTTPARRAFPGWGSAVHPTTRNGLSCTKYTLSEKYEKYVARKASPSTDG